MSINYFHFKEKVKNLLIKILLHLFLISYSFFCILKIQFVKMFLFTFIFVWHYVDSIVKIGFLGML